MHILTAMFVDKIKSGQSGILLYGITPPKSETSPERTAEIAGKTIARLIPLDFDALVVYDVQDESARTAEERPFPFLKAFDPFLGNNHRVVTKFGKGIQRALLIKKTRIQHQSPLKHLLD